MNLLKEKKFVKKVWKKLDNLQAVALLTTGRAGSDFFQSLFDGHSSVLTFNGSFFFYNFWNDLHLNKINQSNVDLENIINKFIKKFIHKLQSKRDKFENKHKLGINKNKSININLKNYKFCLKKLLENKKINSKNFLLAATASYEMILGRNIFKKKILLHHHHRISKKIDYFENDFSKSKKICMYRDPRQLYISGIMNWNKIRKETRYIGFNNYILNRTINEIQTLKKNKSTLIVKLETLGSDKIIKKICKWMGIKYEQVLCKSTFGGLLWWGDKISNRKKSKKELGFSKKISEPNWKKNMYLSERIVLNHLMYNPLRYFNYKLDLGCNIYWFPLVIFLAILPFKNETKHFNPSNFFKKDSFIYIKQFYQYFKRILICYKFIFKRYFFSVKPFIYFDSKHI